jgi:hypothetical protein
MNSREEVAWKLRRIEEDVDYETAFMEIDTIIGTKDNYSFSFFFNRLANLIDPTCHMSWEYDNGDDDTDEYMELIADTPEDTVACHCHACDIVFRFERNIVPGYCPFCGARVVHDEA